MIGKVIKDRYLIYDEIGQGSVAAVYLAKDTARNLVVALKIIHPEQAAQSQFLQRFRREAKLLETLSSPQAVQVLDYGEDDGLNFIALEYIQGRTLAAILEQEGPLEVDRALDIARQVGLCLADAHAKGIVHRDIRPANIMLTADGTVKVMDFGVAQAADLSRLTVTGILGSPHYLSPEQGQGQKVDSRSDIYSLGVTLFEMLTGERPYDAENPVDIVMKHLNAPIPSLRQRDKEIPVEVDGLVKKCLAKKREDRFQSAAEFLEAIEETLRTMAVASTPAIGMEGALTGQTLGPYRLTERIGRGGMATVYKAYEPSLDRYVAIKVLPQYLSHDPSFEVRFRREAKAIAKLNHPNILPIHGFGQEGELTYIAMRLVEEGTLKDMMGQPMELERAVKIFSQVGRALDYAHRQGVVHRDVKPSNVLMSEEDWALLADFGLARMAESSTQLTKTGVGVGTPAYMSPEQGQGQKVDSRSDIYSLGIMLYEMLTGRVPFEAETPMAVVIKHITAPLPMPREINPDIPEVVERVILKAVAKNPNDRYQTVEEMIEALERAVAGAPPEVKPVPVEEVPFAVVAEPTPAPAVAVPVEAPPVARKGLPVWVWGVVGVVVLLIVGAAASGLIRGGEPTPTSAPALTEPPPPATPTPMPPTPTPTPVLPTRTLTPVPPTPTHTPMPSMPTPTPVPPTPTYTPVLPTPTPIPQVPGMSGRIIFTSNRDGAHRLYVLSLPDGPISRLTHSEESDWEPSWGPDGRIAFTCCRSGNYNICVINSDGSGESVLVTRPEWDDHPAWSPNGQYIALSTSGEVEGAWYAQIHKVDLAGNLSRLTFARSEEHYPSWSPDGVWIAFDSERDGNREIYKMWADGTNVTRLTHDGAFDEQAAWSPDGSQIVFIRKTVDTDGGGGIGRDDFGDIWLMNSDGSNPHPLTSCNCAVDPRWSPDGQWIIYARGSGNKTRGSTLWALRVSDEHQVQLTTGPRDWRPAWSR